MKKYLSKLVIFILLMMAVPYLIWQIACVIYEEMKQ